MSQTHPTDLPGASTAASEAKPSSVGALVATVTSQISSLIDNEIKLVKAKATESVKKMSIGGILLAVAGVLGLYALGWGLHSAEVALKLVVPDWAAALIVFSGLLFIIIILALIGLGSLKRGNAQKATISQDFKQNMSANVGIIRKGFSREQH